MSNPSDTMAELHAELKSALRAIENAEDTFKAAVEAVQTAVTDAKDKLQDIAFRLHELAPPTVAAEALFDLQAKPRLTRALAVRDHLVPLIYADGRIQGGNLPFMGLKVGPYQMALNTPKVPFPVGLPWQFDLWGPDGSKLLGLEWEDDGKVEVRDFQAGEWYGVVLTLPGKLPISRLCEKQKRLPPDRASSYVAGR
jgi:hypothetical protein